MRVANWPDVLAKEIDGSLEAPFIWGKNDCCQFVARITTALTDVDRRDLFPTYSSEEEARKIVEGLGGFIPLLSKAFGESKHPAFADRGDVVLVDMGMGPQPAICLGVWCVAPTAKGLAKRMTDSATHAWSVE